MQSSASRLLAIVAVTAGMGGVDQLQATLVSGPITAELQPRVVTAQNFNQPQYQAPPGAGYDGVVGLDVVTTQGVLQCSGSLLNSGRDILTAAHCLAVTGNDLNILSSTISFITPEGELETYAGTHYTLHPEYNGDLRAGNDVAVIRLATTVNPAIQRYDIYTASDEVGRTFDLAGFGSAGTGATGQTTSYGTRRHGLNEFDTTVGATFGQQLPGYTAGTKVLLSDFDSGLSANDGFGFFFGLSGLGLGSNEVNTGFGDSGGPAFINGKVAGMASFGSRLTFGGARTSDIDSSLNSSFGEFAGFTRVSSHTAFINSALSVPEPSTWVLLAGGLALLGAFGRKRFVRPL